MEGFLMYVSEPGHEVDAPSHAAADPDGQPWVNEAVAPLLVMVKRILSHESNLILRSGAGIFTDLAGRSEVVVRQLTANTAHADASRLRVRHIKQLHHPGKMLRRTDRSS
jgi:hypothetical protein